MTFNPQFGLTSKETFSYTGDAIYNNPTLQGIVAGYVTLLSTDTGVTYLYNSSWKQVNPWSFSNNLYDATTITGSFLTYSERAISGSAVSQSGNQGILNNIRAWNIITDYPEYDTGESKYKKHKQVGLYLGERSPNTVYADSINNGSQAFTIEFDITSSESYSGFQGLTGSTVALTGILNHGVYIQTTTKWDFIECTPEGIRSFNHPDISIPINLLNPKRVRIGVRDSDLFLATDDGQSVYALGKFDTVHPSAPVNPFIYFGAPFIGGYSGDSTAFSVTYGATGFSPYAFYGNTVWDNIRILTGDLALYYNTGSNPIYSTGIASMTTAPFDPSISLSAFNRAVIEYMPYKGGVTEVYAQYSGADGWQSASSVVLSHTNSVAVLDLSSVPIYSYPRTNQGIDYATNPIRFKIDQYSYDGLGLPPAVEAITVYADKEQYKIDLLPNWKPYNLSTKVSIGIDTGNFVIQDPQPDTWTSFLFNTPKQDTLLTTANSNGFFTDESKFELPLYFHGSGEFVKGGYYDYCYKNHILHSGSAITGSEASQIFGSNPVSNYFPNPIFSQNFRPITSAEILAFAGTTLNGFLANYAYIPTGYTGIHRIDYSKEVVYRLDTQAEYNRVNSFLGNTLEEQTDYVQRVYVYPNSDTITLDRAAGIELYVPSGIATGNLVVGFDINITTGSYLEFYTTGRSTPFKSIIIDGNNAREYIRIETPITSTGYDSIRLGFVRPYGYPSDELEFYIDNVTVSPLYTSYLTFTGMTGYVHQSGLVTDSVNENIAVPHKASTVFCGNYFIESYPTSNTGVLFQITGSSCGLTIGLRPDGKVEARASHISDSLSTGQNLYNQQLEDIYVVSKDKIPLGTWTTLGFMHDVKHYDKLGYLQYSGNPFPYNFASTNRALITYNGDIQANRDLMSGWLSSPNLLSKRMIFLDFENATSLPSSITFSRSTSGSYVGSSGQFAYANIDSPRMYYNNNRSGLLIEGARTNFARYSRQFTNGVWAATSGGTTITDNYAPGPFNGINASRLQLPTTYGITFQQNATITGGTANKTLTASFYIKSNTGANQSFQIKCTHGGVADNFSSGLTATPEWQLFQFTVTNNSSPGSGTQFIGITKNNSNTLDILISDAQLEEGRFASSRIPTENTAISRSADLATYDLSSTEMSYLNTGGCVLVEYAWFGGNSAMDTDNRFIVSIDNATGEYSHIIHNAYSGTAGRTYNSTIQANPYIAGTVQTGAITKAIYSWKENAFQTWSSGQAGIFDATGTIPSVSKLGIGAMSTGVNFAYAIIYNVSVFSESVTNSGDASLLTSTGSYVNDKAPYTSYIPLTGHLTGIMASGVMCRVDGVAFTRPPVGDVETELSIKSSRNTPYFIPDYLYKGGYAENNIVIENTGIYGNDLFLGMFYNLSSPVLTNWDRGPMSNHLIFYGNRSIEINNPYELEGIYSTRFNTGYAIIPYSSSIERLYNTVGQIGLYSSGNVYGYNDGEMRINGWIYPRETGSFFKLYQNTGLPLGNRFELCIQSDKLVYNKYNSSNVIVNSYTGDTVINNSWNYFNISIASNNEEYHTIDGFNSYSKVTLQSGLTTLSFESTGVDHSFKYNNNSEFILGGIDCNLFNLAIYFPHSGDQNYIIAGANTSIDKGGRAQTLLDGSSVFTGNVSWVNYTLGEFISPASTGINSKFYSLAMYGSYDRSPKLNGMLLYDNKPFKEVNTYHLKYDTSPIERVFGATDSPIRLGTIVPDNAINIARFSGPEYSVDSAINVIDLSDSNVDNLVTYMGGSYSVQPNLVQISELTSYQNINEPIYTGAIDITFSGQVISSDISFTTVYVPDNNGYFGVPLTQYYLLGRGKNLFKLDNAEPHATGQISDFNSSNAESYVANLERIKSSIKFKDRSGKDITSEISFDILTSPYSPDSLISAVNDNRNVSLDNIGSYEYATGKLSNGLFSVIILTNIERDDTVFVHYPSYDPYLDKDLYNHKEIVNPQPIFREKHISEEASIGKFDLNLNSNNYYDLTIYGILSGYSDKL